MTVVSCLAVGATIPASAQDLYDPGTLRTIELTFAQSNWFALLRNNYQSQTEIAADLTMEGVTYPDVGVRIRGNTSYTRLPAGSEKVSLNISMDFTDPDLDLLGYNSLNLNNSFMDPTFCREVAYNNFVAQYIPNGRSNHVILTINGQNWGVYANVQQYNKDMLRDYFDDEDGMRIKCANNPNGPGLTYNGANQSGYTGYEIKNDGGLADPWSELIEVCDAVTNTSLANWEQIDEVFAIDPSIWSVVLENLFTDDDSYVNKGADFVLYRNPVDGRTHLLQTDGNEAWTEPDWDLDHNFNQSTKPVLSHVLDVPELRQRYMAHMRTALQEFDWAQLGPILIAHRDLIDAEVQADPKKLYTYQQFLTNFNSSVIVTGGGGPGGGNRTRVGLEDFVDERELLLEAHPEIAAPAPAISSVSHFPNAPSPADTVYITAQVSGPVVAVASVELFYLPAPGPFQRVTMLDDGHSGDGVAGDGIYGVALPISASSGQSVKYYVGAASANIYSTLSFSPALTELDPAELTYTFGGAGLRITEYMYSASDGEYVELTNTSASTIDLTGWSFDDQSAIPGTFDLSGGGVIQPGSSIIVTDADPAAFATAWSLGGTTILGPTVDASLGRNDQINIFDATGELVERLTYGDEDFPGSVRSKDESGQVCSQAIGSDNAYAWTEASVGDAWGAYNSTGGDTGSPGVHTAVGCSGLGSVYCDPGVLTSTGSPALLRAFGSDTAVDNLVTLVASGIPTGEFGYFLNGTQATLVAAPGGSVGNLCVGGSLGRYNTGIEVFNSGATGEGLLVLDLVLTPTPSGATAIIAGDTWYFQCWFRDTPASTSNFSNGLSITFQ